MGKIKLICKYCNKEFLKYYRPSHLMRGEGVFCSEGCYHKTTSIYPKIDICMHCSKPYKTKFNRAKRKFCSYQCSVYFHSPWIYRRKASQKMKIPDSDLHPQKDYNYIHFRIKSRYGKANKCEKSGCSGKSKLFEWSNKDHQYRLARSDWQMFCRICHKEHDKKLL